MTAAAPGSSVEVESVLARHTVRRAVFVGPPIVVVAALAAGTSGAVAALIGVTIVVGNFLLAGVILSKAARISLGLYHAAALFGFFIRLGLVTLTMLLVVQTVELHRPAMGIAAVVSYLVLLSWEALAVARGSERELEWIR